MNDAITFEAQVRWTGSTGQGWRLYSRAHAASAGSAQQAVKLTTATNYGDPRRLNPEQLVVMAASSCQMLWFLHLAARARIDVVEYVDDATATMREGEGLRDIVLRPRIVAVTDVEEERLLELVHNAHELQHRQEPRAPRLDRAAHRGTYLREGTWRA